jgi:carotenoid cleavage dioxygenase
MQHPLFRALFPWIFFAIFYGLTPEAFFFTSVSALLLEIILNLGELYKKYFLPWGSVVYFIFLGISSRTNILPWANEHSLILFNLGLPIISMGSMLVAKPFSLQYTREQIDPVYWHSPGFIKVNWLITGMWASFMLLTLIPNFIMTSAQVLDAWFWNYSLTILAIVSALVLTKKIPNFYIGQTFWRQVKTMPPIKSHYLQGAYAPVKDEVDLNELKIEGHLPVTLNGIYLRNGPNPLFTPYSYTYPIDGDGMIHGVKLTHGWAEYKNRFVKTKGLVAEQKAGKALYGGIKLPLLPDPKYVEDGPTKNTASIHIAMLGPYLLALYESMPAYAMDKNLNTLGEWAPNGIKPFNINAHHRRDSKTGHIFACTYDVVDAPYLTFYEFDAQAQLLKIMPVDKAYSTMIHDFVITENYLVVFDAPAIFDINTKEVLIYQPDKPVNILLIGRHNGEIKKITTESFFVYHFVNAYEQDHKVIVDFIHHETLRLNPGAIQKNTRGPRLYRAEIDLHQLTYQHFCLSELTVEFPTYNLGHTGQMHRYAYFCAKSSAIAENFDTIMKYDFVERTQQTFNIGQNIEVDEAIFVPEKNPNAEDHGYLMLFVYRRDFGTSDFVLLDAQKPKTIKPLAIIKLGRRVPHGLHGSWLPR